MVGEADQRPTGEGSDVQAIVVSDSLKMGFHGQLALETRLSTDLREVSLTHVEVQGDTPLEQVASQPDKVTSTQTRRSRPFLPDWLLLNSYIPPQGHTPPMEEVSAPGPKGAHKIINR